MLSETASLKVASDYATSGKENGNNRIKAYFESSSFLQQQYEIAMFIKNFPIIKVS